MRVRIVILLAALLVTGAAGARKAAESLDTPARARPPVERPTAPAPERIEISGAEVMTICTIALVAAMHGDDDALARQLEGMAPGKAAMMAMLCSAFIQGAIVREQIGAPAPAPEQAPEPAPEPATAI